MNALKVMLYVAATALGVFLVIYGEGDDSPVAQLLGLVIAIVGVVSVVRAVRNVAK